MLERGQAKQDPRRAKSTLAGAGGDKRLDPALAEFVVEAFDRRDRSPADPTQGRDAGDPGRAVDPHGATAALPLGTAAVLDRAAVEVLPQGVEQRGVLIVDRGGSAIEGEGDGGNRREVAQLKEEPHPQVRVALGFTMWNPGPLETIAVVEGRSGEELRARGVDDHLDRSVAEFAHNVVGKDF